MACVKVRGGLSDETERIFSCFALGAGLSIHSSLLHSKMEARQRSWAVLLAVAGSPFRSETIERGSKLYPVRIEHNEMRTVVIGAVVPLPEPSCYLSRAALFSPFGVLLSPQLKQ